MKTFLYCSIIISLFFVSCSDRSSIHRELLIIEDSIQEKPLESYYRLDSLDISLSKSRRDKALYSLLYSMALDKNYVDMKSDSLLRPAIDYYVGHGDKYHRFLTYYYLGRINENAGQYDEALRNFIISESFLGTSIPGEYVVRLYCAKGRVYIRQFAIDRSLEQSLKAEEASRGLQNPQFFIRTALDVVADYIMLERYQEGDEQLRQLSEWLDNNNIQPPSDYYASKLRIRLTHPKLYSDDISQLYSCYEEACARGGRKISPLLAAEVSCYIGDYKAAERIVNTMDSLYASDDFTQIEYWALMSNLNKGLERYPEAFNAQLQYQTAVERVNNSVYVNDVRFLQERYESAMAASRARRLRAWLIFGLVILLAAVVALIDISLKRRRKYQDAILEAKGEYEYIIKLIRHDGHTNNQVNDILRTRLVALKPYLDDSGKSHKMPNSKEVAKLVHDRSKMLESLGLLCALTHPRFVSLLAEKGLDAEEIGICSLYVSDYQPKELPDILGKGSIYHRNLEIRNKLADLVIDTTLPAWLRKQYAELA